MNDVVLFTEPGCRYCDAARAFLAAKGVTVTEIDVGGNAEAREVVERMSGSALVPQVFVSDRHIGSYEELRRLDESGQLDQILADTPEPGEETTLSLIF